LIKSTTNINGGVSLFEYELRNETNVPRVFKTYYEGNEPNITTYSEDFTNFTFGWNLKKIINHDPIKEKYILTEYNYYNPKLTLELLPTSFEYDGTIFKGEEDERYANIFYNKTETIYEENGKKINYFYNGPTESGDREGDLLKGTNYKTELYSEDDELIYSHINNYKVNEKASNPTIYSILLKNQTTNNKEYIQYKEIEYNEFDQPIVETIGYGENKVKTYTKYLHENNPEILDENLFRLVEYNAQGNEDTSISDIELNKKLLDSLIKQEFEYITPSNLRSLSLNSIKIYDKNTNRFIEQDTYNYTLNGLIKEQTSNGVKTEFTYTDTNLIEQTKTLIGTQKNIYDNKDNLIQKIGLNDEKTNYVYDDFNRIKAIYLPGEEVAYQTYSYKEYNKIESSYTDEDHEYETITIDTSIHNPSNIITNEYITLDKLKTTKTYYDGFGNQIAVDTNKGDCKFERCSEILRTYIGHDRFGNILKQSKPISILRTDNSFIFPEDIEFIKHEYSNDPLAELEKSYDFSGTLVSSKIEYGLGEKLITETTDALGNTIKTTNDNFGRTIEVEDSLGRKQVFEYSDTSTNIKTYIDPLNRDTNNIYDFRGNNIYSYDPDRGYLTNFYDDNNNLVYTSINNFIIDSGFELENEKYFNSNEFSFGPSYNIEYLSSGCYSGKCLRLLGMGKIDYIYEIPFNQKEEVIIGTYAKGGGVLFEIEYLDSNLDIITTQRRGNSLTSDWKNYTYNLTSPLNTEYIKLKIQTFGTVYLDNLYLTSNKAEKIDYLVFYKTYDNLNRIKATHLLERYSIDEKEYGDEGVVEGGSPICENGIGKICYQATDNQIIHFEYNEKGFLEKQIIQNKLDTTNIEQIEVINTFSLASLINKEINEKNIKYIYDNLGRITEIKYIDKDIASFDIDDQGRLKKLSYGNEFENEYEYDINNRLIELRTAKNSINYFARQYVYDDLSNIISINKLSPIFGSSAIGISEDGETTVSTSYEWQNLVRFRYDEANRLTDTLSNDPSLFEDASYVYDELDNRLIKYSREGTTNYEYEFYDGGNSVILNSANTPEGEYIYEYDNMNRLISKKLKNPSVSFAGPTTGGPLVEGANETIYEITYDDKGNLKTINGSFGNEEYYYSVNGKRIINIINNSEVIYYFWDGDKTIYEITKKLKDVEEPVSTIITIPLDIGWNMVSVGAFKELDNSLYKTAYYYDSSTGRYGTIDEKTDLDLLSGVWVYMNKPTKVSFETYDSKNLKTTNSKFEMISFNSQKDIDSFEKNTVNTKISIYSMDPKTGRYSLVSADELEPGLGYWVYTDTSTIIKPSLDIETGESGKPPSLEGDETLYIYAGQNLISRVDFDSPESLVHAPLDPKIYYYHNDHRLNPRLITDENGSVVMKTDYDIFGAQLNLAQEIENRKDFVGHEQDSSGLQYFGARFYDPQLGRFISPDPIKDGLNPFVYAQNNPMKYVDLNGNEMYPIGFSNYPPHVMEMERNTQILIQMVHNAHEIFYNGFNSEFIDNTRITTNEMYIQVNSLNPELDGKWRVVDHTFSNGGDPQNQNIYEVMDSLSAEVPIDWTNEMNMLYYPEEMADIFAAGKFTADMSLNFMLGRFTPSCGPLVDFVMSLLGPGYSNNPSGLAAAGMHMSLKIYRRGKQEKEGVTEVNHNPYPSNYIPDFMGSNPMGLRE